VHDLPVGGRDYEVRAGRRPAIGIAEEEGEKTGEQDERHSPPRPAQQKQRHGRGERTADKWKSGSIDDLERHRAMTAQDVFHPILEMKLPLLDLRFFDLLGIRKVTFAGKAGQAFIEVVVLRD
jgi:hypothetical protein